MPPCYSPLKGDLNGDDLDEFGWLVGPLSQQAHFRQQRLKRALLVGRALSVAEQVAAFKRVGE
jgi:hypothetical protein